MRVNKTAVNLLVCRADAPRVLPDCILVSMRADVNLDVGKSNQERWCRAGVFVPIRYTLLYSFADKSVHFIRHSATGCDPNTCKHNISKLLHFAIQIRLPKLIDRLKVNSHYPKNPEPIVTDIC